MHTDVPRILVVEPDDALRSALAFALEAEGWKADAFRSGATSLASAASYDCLVVDHRLDDMGGLALIETLRDRGLKAPAILVAANAGERARRLAAETGVEILEKPIIGDALRQRVQAALAAR